ncbi:MAG: Ig-like domain-containing protein, partial [Saprospiraceae bacterium]|nr:Ig-like domain-containing protein [Saprospiraceae bacterium]
MTKLTSNLSFAIVLFVFQTFISGPVIEKKEVSNNPSSELQLRSFDSNSECVALNSECAALSTPTVVAAGSVIIDMGVVPQTVANGLKPYGMIFDLIKNHGISVLWIIDENKMSDKNTGSDAVDFSYGGQDFKGGPFIIPAAYLSPDVNATINSWIAKGVQTVTITSDVNVPVFVELNGVPNWTLDAGNGGKVIPGLEGAEIPEFNDAAQTDANYIFKPTDQLDCCDYLYVMPHADPIWETHGNLYNWVQSKSNGGCRGWIWSACHAVSALENAFDYITPDANLQMNFLSEKLGVADLGNDPWAENSLVLWGDHDGGDEEYDYDNNSNGHPFMQFMGKLDGSQESGSESIYMPYNGTTWRANTTVSVYDSNQPDLGNVAGDRAAKLAYGPALGVGSYLDYTSGNGWVMYEGGHSIGGDEPQYVAAYRAFMNFSFMAAVGRGADVTYSMPPPATIVQGTTINLEAIAANSQPNYTFEWSVSPNIGSFSDNQIMKGDNETASTMYSSPASGSTVNAIISLKVYDDCSIVKTINQSVILLPTPPSPPTCYNTILGAAPNSPLVVDLLSETVDINGDVQASGITILTQPLNGELILDASGRATYTPDFNYNGTDSYIYQACDDAGLCCTGTIDITIDCPLDLTMNGIYGSVYFDGGITGVIDGQDYAYSSFADIKLYEDNPPIGTLDITDNLLQTTTTDNNGAYDFLLAPAYNVTITSPVSSGADDMHQTYEELNLTSGSYELKSGKDEYIGLHFTNIDIPQGAMINSAVIRYDLQGGDRNSTINNTSISALDVSNAPVIDNIGGTLIAAFEGSGISPVTGSFMTGNRDDQFDTYDISSVISALVTKPDWMLNNSILLVHKAKDNNGDTPNVFTFDGSNISDGDFPPQLVITYNTTNNVVYTIGSSAEDAAEDRLPKSENGFNDSTLGSNTSSYHAYRFTNLNIPNGTTITSAVIQYDLADGTENVAVSDIYITAQDVADAPALPAASDPSYDLSVMYNISGITPVTGTMMTGLQNETFNSFDISSVINNVVSKVGWISGNDITLIAKTALNSNASASPSVFFQEGSNGTTDLAPTLILTFDRSSVNYMVEIDATSLNVAELEMVTPVASPLNNYSVSFTALGSSQCENDFGVLKPNIDPLVKEEYGLAFQGCLGNKQSIIFSYLDPDEILGPGFFTIESLPTAGKLVLNGLDITLAPQIILITDILEFEADGTVNGNLSFTYSYTDSRTGPTSPIQDPKKSKIETYNLIINNCPPETYDKTNSSMSSTAGPTSLDNDPLTGLDGDGVITGFRIATVPLDIQGTLLLNGTAVSPGQIIPIADINLLSFAPSGSFLGNVTFQFSAIDNDNAQDLTPATYTIPIVNTPPSANDITFPFCLVDTIADQTITGLLGTDIDGFVSNYIIKTLPLTGILKVDGALAIPNMMISVEQAATLSYTPIPGFSGPVTFTYDATDDQFSTSLTAGTYTINVSTSPTVNDVIVNEVILITDGQIEVTPSISGIDDGIIVEYYFTSIPAASEGTLYFKNPSLTPVLVNDPLSITELGDLVFIPSGSYYGTITTHYVGVDDCGLISDPADYILTVLPVPMLVDDRDTTIENTPTVVDVFENDIFVPPIGFFTNSVPLHGTVEITGPLLTLVDPRDDVLTYTPEPGYSGIDSFEYMICDALMVCDTAVVVMGVDPTPIEAVDDDFTGSPINGFVGGFTPNILLNDSLYGTVVDPMNVILSSVPTGNTNLAQVHLDGTTGFVKIEQSTPAQDYDVVYSICETVNPSICDTAVVKVKVIPASIDAIDDDYTATPFNGKDGGLTNNILLNDSLNNMVVDPMEITLSPVTLGTTNDMLVHLDGTTGLVKVEANTPARDYDVVYKICEDLNPMNCDEATVTVTVEPAPIVALNNDYTSTPFNGKDGGSTLNILANDSLNYVVVDPMDITLTPVTLGTTNAMLVHLDGTTGLVKIEPGTPAGDYDVVYQICENLNSMNCDTAIVTVVVEPAPIVALDNDYTSTPFNSLNGG